MKLSALNKALSTLPKTLDETYHRILQGIESAGHRQDAITALRWLCFSETPLLLSQIIEVLAIENGDSGGFCPDERLPEPTDIMVICSSLISCSKNQVRLAHFSVKEYLLSDRCLWTFDLQTLTCHMAMAESCLHYLLYLFEKWPLTTDLLDQHPLSKYAAEYWWQHALAAGDTLNPTVISLALKLLMNEEAGVLPWIQVYNIDKRYPETDLSLTIENVASPLYYAASIGLSQVVEDILAKKVDVNVEGGFHGHALQAASVYGYEKVVPILLNAGADFNAKGGFFGTALQAASLDGHVNVVQLLLEAEANVNAEGGHYGTALQAASLNGHVNVVQLLLDAGANVNAAEGDYGNALRAA